MNPNPPPIPASPLSASMSELAVAPAVPALAPGERLAPACLATAGVVLLGDFLFWKHGIGLSLALFFVALAVLIVALNRRAAAGPRVWAAFGLLLISAWQTAVEISFTNLAVVAALLAALLADLRYLHLPAGWARWSESLVAWAAGLGRWPWLVRALNEQPRVVVSERPLGASIGRLVGMTLPAVLLLFVFITIFAMGNRIFHQYFSRSMNHVYDWFAGLDFNPGRIFFWLLLATIGLVFARPRDGARTPRAWTRPLAEWKRTDAGMAFGQSVLILLALNVLFFAVNTIDVVYLWQRAAPPEGVLARDYLYHGVYSLITATVLAGVVLTFLFQQPAAVTDRRGLRLLAFAWIAQNFVLIAGVFLRLKLFLELSDVTEKRVYVACFLLLVATGFVLLCRHVALGRMASRLIWHNVVATFVLFFVLQFLNVTGWVARQNFSRPERLPNSWINVPYNANLGPGSWPALIEISGGLSAGDVRNDLLLDLRERARTERLRLAGLDWRQRQWRHDRNAAALIAWAAPFGELTEEEQKSPAIKAMYQTERDLRYTIDD